MSEEFLQRYTDCFAQLSPENLDTLAAVMTDDVHFIDPFNDVTGLNKVEEIFRHMFHNLEDAKFTVTHSAVDAAGAGRGLMRWELDSRLNGKPYRIVGMTEVGFAADGRINEHIDHWDSGQQFYAKIPVIGWLLRLIRARLTV
jgi:steroid delta-isomerase